MTRVSELHARWVQQKDYQAEYDSLEGEFALVREMILARTAAGLTQDELAKRMNTSQSVVARLESGRSSPSTKTLARLASATGTQLSIRFVADPPKTKPTPAPSR